MTKTTPITHEPSQKSCESGAESQDPTVLELEYETKAKALRPTNMVVVNAAWAHEKGLQERQHMSLVNMDSGKSSECILITLSEENEGPAHGKAQATQFSIDKLDLKKGNRLRLVEYPESDSMVIEPFGYQKLTYVKEGIVAVSPAVYEFIKKNDLERPKNQDCYYRISHLASGSLYHVPCEKIKEDKNMQSETDLPSKNIRLSSYQKILLNIKNPPSLLDASFFEMLDFAEGVDAEKQLIKEAYGKSGDLRISKEDQQNKELFDALKKCGFMKLQIMPTNMQYPKKKRRTRVLQWLSHFVIGNSSQELKCCHPYACDENDDVIRLSKASLTRLGIEENDKVNVRNCDKKVTVRARLTDSFELLNATNSMVEEAEMNFVVGIPAHVRGQLEIREMDECVLVERRVPYLVKKSFYLHLVPMILFVLAVLEVANAFNLIHWGGLTLTGVIGLPIIAYIVVSEFRAKVK